MEGATVGSYAVKSLIGKGGMGEVYLAEHMLLKRPVAIKFLLPALSSEEEVVERFFNEARITSAIADPGIVSVFDFGYHIDGSAYIVMEYLVGETLDHRLEGDGPIDVAPALRITRHLANALHKAHSNGVIHRDLKLENIFLVADPAVAGGERPKILDFGIAKLAQPELGRSVTRTGAIMGTPIYMSPEQCKGAHDVDARSDLYSLGCVLFCMVVGRPPFDFDSAGEIIAAHLREPPPQPSSIRSDLPPELDAIIARCLAKDPNARFQSMSELSRTITECLDDELTVGRSGKVGSGPFTRNLTPPVSPQPTTLTSAVVATSAPSSSRKRMWAVVAGLAVAAGAAFAVTSLFKHPSTPGAPTAPVTAVPTTNPGATTAGSNPSPGSAGLGSGSGSVIIDPVPTGSGSGSVVATGSGSGSVIATGSGSGSVIATGSGSGNVIATGSGSGSGKKSSGKNPGGHRHGSGAGSASAGTGSSIENMGRGD